LPNITSNSPATKLDTTSWNLPNDILLADEHFDKPGAIDLLTGAELTFAVEFLHQRGIIHKDIKPKNILLDKDGHCKLGESGLAALGIFKRK